MQNMKQIKVKENQTIFDIAIEQYGTCEAVEELLKLNPNIINDARAKTNVEVKDSDEDFYIDLAIAEGFLITINSDSELKQNNILRELQNIDITTFNYGKNN